MRARSFAVVIAVLLAATGWAEAQAPITALRVSGAGPITDPLAALWKDARPVKIAMLPQTVVAPQKTDAAIKELSVRAVHNGGWLAVRIEWKDPTV